nr:hypothetical protein BaRGS_028306 [Batillaria attramentaria]
MAVGKYGILDDDSCNATCLSTRCGNDVTMSVAVYRAYDKQCTDPPDVANTTRSETYLVTPPAGVFNFGSTVTYTCITGHEFPDLTTVTTVECPVPDPVPNSRMTYSGIQYSAQAVYTCHNNYETETGANSAVSYCSASKVWNPPPPVCAGADNCMLHATFLTSPVYTADSAWDAFELGQDCN